MQDAKTLAGETSCNFKKYLENPAAALLRSYLSCFSSFSKNTLAGVLVARIDAQGFFMSG
jgi:hypothetical protein